MVDKASRLKANLYIGAVIVAGMAVLLFSLREILKSSDFKWVVLALLTAIASFFPVYLPRLKGRDRGVVLTISSIFIFTSILLFGPAVAAVMSTVEACVSSWKSRKSIRSLYKILFNVFHLPLVTYIVARLFYFLHNTSAPLDPTGEQNIPVLFITLGFSSIAYFLLNAGAISIAISLVTGYSLRVTWRQSFISAALTNFAEASAAVVVFLNFHQTSLLAVGIAMPTAVVIYYAYKMNLARIDEAQKHVEEVNELYHATIEALAMAVDAKDQVTHGHIYRVQAMVVGLAKHCGIANDNDLEGMRAAALLHDIGKLATPDYILNKPGPLTDSEMETMKTHAAVGADILSSVPFPYPVVPFVRYHHEKWDGNGYPEGLTGEAIPLGARILSIVDCYDALRSDRPYRASLSREATLEYIKSESGKSYDPAVVTALVGHIDELEAETIQVESQFNQKEIREARITRIPGHQDKNGLSNTVFHDIASAHREVQALHEISQAVGRLLNVSETLSLLADKIKNIVPYSACAVYLANSNNEKLVPYHTSGLLSDQINALEIKTGEGVTGWVAANYRALANVSPAPDFAGCVELRTQLQSCLAVPLVLDQDVVGVITLYSEQSNAFRPNHLRLMENVSQHAATAISNAIVYEETKEDAYTDILTGLPNLRYFNAFVEQELKRAKNSNYPVTVLIMDLDGFKRINDERGHKIGDRVLIEISHVLRNQLRKSDTCIRYGGDEFIGILPGADRAATRALVSKIQDAVDNHPISAGSDESVFVGISIGAATFPEDGNKLDQLMVIADQGMYRNKVARAPQENRGGADLLRFERQA